MLSANEPSAFDAGNLDLDAPYGLTQSEQAILKNKKEIANNSEELDALETKIKTLVRKIESQEEKISGLLSAVDGTNEGINDRIMRQQEKIAKLEEENSAHQKQLALVKEQLSSSQQEIEKKFISAMTELGDIINGINKDYVDKKRFRKLEDAFFELEQSVTSGNVHDFGEDNWAIYVTMQEYYEKQEYDEVKSRANHLIAQNYKRASANFYLGEVYFRQKAYEDAIYHFKESWSIYDKSEFMPVLLLHTALSLEKTGKTSEANAFYENLIESYPGSEEATQAKQNLKD
ncbi:MAG: tetratricopeptide repeat protein [Campylobacterota bacterium]